MAGESSVEVICSQERWVISSERAEYWENTVRGFKSPNPINDAITSRLDKTRQLRRSALRQLLWSVWDHPNTTGSCRVDFYLITIESCAHTRHVSARCFREQRYSPVSERKGTEIGHANQKRQIKILFISHSEQDRLRKEVCFSSALVPEGND